MEAKITALIPDEQCVHNGVQMLFGSDGGVAKNAFCNALGVWLACQDRPRTVEKAAEAFNATPYVIRAAVLEHQWLCLIGDEIELEGV